MARLLIITASTRPGRRGAPVSEWIAREAVDHGAFDVCAADLAAIDLPLLDEPNDNERGAYIHAHTTQWSATVERADAFVVVTPEYNNSFPASLKNAIDYLYDEWRYKPVGIVSYGGLSGGLRAATAIKAVFAAVSLMPVENAVAIRDIKRQIVDGKLTVTESMRVSAHGMFDELNRVEAALAPLRSKATV